MAGGVNRPCLQQKGHFMVRTLTLSLFFSTALVLAPGIAAADDAPASGDSARDAVAPAEDVSPVPWRAPTGRGIAIGYENGFWGTAFEQGVRVRIPLHTNWGVLGKGLYIHDFDTPT